MLFLRPIFATSLVRCTLVLLLLAAFAASFLPPVSQAQKQQSFINSVSSAISDPAVEGWVTDQASKQPVAAATVKINGVTVATSGPDGYFAIPVADIATADSASKADTQTLQVEITQPDHASWIINDALFYKGDTLRLYPRLAPSGNAATVHSAPSISSSAPSLLANGRTLSSNAGLSLSMSVLSTNPQVAAQQAAGLTPPATIRVYRTETQVVEVVPFKDYLKHVLPSEWIPTWGAASLKAGAMAVKSYAWYWVALGGKQVALQADVKDNTEDQVYDPDISYASTDAAVDATFPYVLTLNGSLFQANYCAGSYNADPTGDCPWPGPYLTQWGSDYFADQGRSWGWILQFYYPGANISPTPPGGGYDGVPVPTSPAKPTPTSISPISTPFTVGQGADNPHVYVDAYNRNGGEKTLGHPAGAVHWWLQDVSENNVQAQAFTGPDGKGNTWLIFDVLKSTSLGVQYAYALQGDIARAYSTHTPAGPNWVGAPTSDSYTSSTAPGGVISQGFAKGTLSMQNGSVQFAPWPTTFAGWKAEYFVGHTADNMQAPVTTLPGQAALVADIASPGLAWSAEKNVQATLGVGVADWSAQFTRLAQVDGGTYDFSLSGDSGVRLWVDNVLAINGWNWTTLQQARYSTDFTGGAHTIRLQYFSLGGAAQLGFDMQKRVANNPPSIVKPQPTAGTLGTTDGQDNAQLRVHVTWLGRGEAPSDAWVQPLTLQLSNPSDNRVLGSYSGSTDRNGVAFYSSLPAGIYNVHVKGTHSLQSARASIALTSQTTTDVDMSVQIEGDTDGDNCVTVDDLTLVQSLLGTDKSMPGFNASADLNGDGRVDLTDISLLRSGFDMCGDISADNQFTIESTDKAPTLQQQLAPWLAPGQLQHNLSMYLTLSASAAGIGQTVDVQVVADSGTQPVDGASFVLKYDPVVLAPVDSSGNPAMAATPGMALPSVLGSWLDAKGGSVGYSANIVQGQFPQGKLVVAKLRFKVLSAPASGATAISFLPASSGFAQITAGGVNLLANVTGTTLIVTP